MDLYERIKEVASAKGISINKLEKDLNLPRSSVRKYSKNKPNAERIGTIADYLGVSADYLINGNVDISGGVHTDVQAPEYYKDKKAADILAGGGWKTASVMRSVYRHSMAKNKASAAISSLIQNRSHL